MNDSRERTTEEVRQEFIEHIRCMVDYWERVKLEPERGTTDARRRLRGLAHSILVTLDGRSNLPAFIVAPRPHERDKAYHQENGEDWYPENHEANVQCDITGGLHDQLYEDWR